LERQNGKSYISENLEVKCDNLTLGNELPERISKGRESDMTDQPNEVARTSDAIQTLRAALDLKEKGWIV
jgi:hypothetical protein